MNTATIDEAVAGAKRITSRDPAREQPDDLKKLSDLMALLPSDLVRRNVFFNLATSSVEEIGVRVTKGDPSPHLPGAFAVARMIRLTHLAHAVSQIRRAMFEASLSASDLCQLGLAEYRQNHRGHDTLVLFLGADALKEAAKKLEEWGRDNKVYARASEIIWEHLTESNRRREARKARAVARTDKEVSA